MLSDEIDTKLISLMSQNFDKRFSNGPWDFMNIANFNYAARNLSMKICQGHYWLLVCELLLIYNSLTKHNLQTFHTESYLPRVLAIQVVIKKIANYL